MPSYLASYVRGRINTELSGHVITARIKVDELCNNNNNNNNNRIQRPIRDFFYNSPHNAANCLQHVRSSGPGAIVCKSRATHRALIMCKCHVTCHLVQRDSSVIKFDRVETAFI